MKKVLSVLLAVFLLAGTMPGVAAADQTEAPGRTEAAQKPEKENQEDLLPVYRIYNPYTGEHLYSSNAEEKDSLIKAGWTLEGLGWNSPGEGTEICRLYNPQDETHLYTYSKREIQSCLKAGWEIDGVVGYSADEKEGVPVYRLFNPYARTHYHLFTVNQEEVDVLTEAGWLLEGTAWYAVKEK